MACSEGQPDSGTARTWGQAASLSPVYPRMFRVPDPPRGLQTDWDEPLQLGTSRASRISAEGYKSRGLASRQKPYPDARTSLKQSIPPSPPPLKSPSYCPEKKKPLEEGKFWIDCAVSPKRRILDPAETKQLCIGKIFFWPQMEMRIHELSWLQLWEIFFSITFAPLWLWLRLSFCYLWNCQ